MIYMRRLVVLCVALPLALFEATPAQSAQGSGLCFHARPKPDCSAFILTNFGTYLMLGRTERYNSRLRAIGDWGFMVNVGARDAVGPSVFASLDDGGR
jgi:hypothetical protein